MNRFSKREKETKKEPVYEYNSRGVDLNASKSSYKPRSTSNVIGGSRKVSELIKKLRKKKKDNNEVELSIDHLQLD